MEQQNPAWQPLPEAELQRMKYELGQKMSYDRDDNQRAQGQNIQSNVGYGFVKQSIQREMYSPAAQTITAALQSDSQSITVDSLTSGAVQAVFLTPNAGVIKLNLLNSQNDVLLHISARVTHLNHSNTLVLNSRTAQGSWQEEVRPEGFPFPCCGYVTIITLRIENTESAFIISANDIEITNYEYRSGLYPPVDEFECYFVDTDATKKGKLISLSVDY